MGCWDIYCFLCGFPCYSTGFEYKNFLEQIETYKANKGNLNFRKYFKPIYEEYLKDPKIFIKKYIQLNKDTKWLNKNTFLCANNKVIHGCTEFACSSTFFDKKGIHYTHSAVYNEFELYGVFTHSDCWKFIKNKYKIDLTYSYLPIVNVNIKQTDKKIFKFIDYGLIEDCWGQFFDFEKLIVLGKEDLCSSPLKNKLLDKHIISVFNKLKIRTGDKRSGPIPSATFYKAGTYKVGLDGNIWVTKGGKWTLTSQTGPEHSNTVKIKFTSSNLKVIKKIVFIGDSNTEPLFVVNIKKNKKTTEYELLSIKEYILDKYSNYIK